LTPYQDPDRYYRTVVLILGNGIDLAMRSSPAITTRCKGGKGGTVAFGAGLVSCSVLGSINGDGDGDRGEEDGI
jgi:hypothetical protein